MGQSLTQALQTQLSGEVSLNRETRTEAKKIVEPTAEQIGPQTVIILPEHLVVQEEVASQHEEEDEEESRMTCQHVALERCNRDRGGHEDQAEREDSTYKHHRIQQALVRYPIGKPLEESQNAGVDGRVQHREQENELDVVQQEIPEPTETNYLFQETIYTNYYTRAIYKRTLNPKL